MNDTLKLWLAGIVFFCGLGVAGTMDYNDQAAEAKAYCEDVGSGKLVDYKGTFEKDCRL